MVRQFDPLGVIVLPVVGVLVLRMPAHIVHNGTFVNEPRRRGRERGGEKERKNYSKINRKKRNIKIVFRKILCCRRRGRSHVRYRFPMCLNMFASITVQYHES